LIEGKSMPFFYRKTNVLSLFNDRSLYAPLGNALADRGLRPIFLDEPEEIEEYLSGPSVILASIECAPKVYKWLSARPRNATLPTIVIGPSSGPAETMIYAARADAYLVRPANIEELNITILRLASDP
jgi:hypothetical protein